MGVLRFVLGLAVAAGMIYVMLARRAPSVPPPEGQPPSTAASAPGQTAENMKRQFEAAQQKADERGDDVQKKLDDAVQGK